jgi:hypothetical protein
MLYCLYHFLACALLLVLHVTGRTGVVLLVPAAGARIIGRQGFMTTAFDRLSPGQTFTMTHGTQTITITFNKWVL